MIRFLKLFVLFCMLLTLQQRTFAAEPHVAVFTANGDFDDVKDNIVFAINGRGLVINNTSHIGEMLERTGRDLGVGKQIYLKAESLEFCSATVSRKMMEADPHNIIFCPYIISVYVLPADPKKIYVAYRKPDIAGTPQSQEALKAVDDLLTGIISEALK